MNTSRHRGATPRRIAVTVAATTVGLLIGIGSAAAYWATTGTGTGAASARTMVAPTVAAGTASGTGLYPGLSANGTSQGGNLDVSVTNSNPFPVTVTLTQNGQPAQCTTPAITLLTSPALTVTVAANSNATKTFSNVVSMGDSSNDCQGKTLSIPLTTSAVSN